MGRLWDKENRAHNPPADTSVLNSLHFLYTQVGGGHLMACAHSFYFRKHLLPSSFPLSCAQPVPLKKNKKQKNGLSCYSFCDQLPPVTPMLMWNINSLGAQTETHHFVEIHYLSSCLWIRTSPVSSDLRAFFKVVRRDIIVPAAIKKHMCLLFFFSFFFKGVRQAAPDVCVE